MRKLTLDDFQSRAPWLADACDAKTLASIIDAYNFIVPEDGKPLEDMSILLDSVCALSRQNRKRLPCGPGTKGLLHCVVALSICDEVPGAAYWVNHLEESLSILAGSPSWPSVRSGYRKMLHGNSIIAMAVEAHIGASLSRIGHDLKMHVIGGGDVHVDLKGITICAEVKTKAGSFSTTPGIDTSGILKGDLDHPIILREVRAPKCEDELLEYAGEVLCEYKKAQAELARTGQCSGTYQHHVPGGKYIQSIGIISQCYKPGSGMIYGTISGDFGKTIEDDIAPWIFDKISEADGQMLPRDSSRANVAVLMLPASEAALEGINDDLTEFLGQELNCQRLDAVVIGEFFSMPDTSSIGYRCRVFDLNSKKQWPVDVCAAIVKAIT